MSEIKKKARSPGQSLDLYLVPLSTSSIDLTMAPSRGNLNSGKNHDSAKKAIIDDSPKKQTGTVPLDLQQRTLDIFKTAFANDFDADLSATLQKVKQHLYDRDFGTAFGREEFLRAYSARWSPSRALGYLQVLSDTTGGFPFSVKAYDKIAHDEAHKPSEADETHIKVACLGAGAGAEIVAFAAHIHQRMSEAPEEKSLQLDITVIDIADWSSIVENLCTTVILPPKLSVHVSVSLQADHIPFLGPESFKCRFHRADLLKMDFSELQNWLEAVDVVTLMFTLNELYSTSLSQTQRFLLRLGACVKTGSLFLVVDSPGSYSTIQLNGKEKRYPMQWLLDYTLLPSSASEADDARWEKLVMDESRWFRLPADLEYPIQLENMRYQIHLYRRI